MKKLPILALFIAMTMGVFSYANAYTDNTSEFSISQAGIFTTSICVLNSGNTALNVWIGLQYNTSSFIVNEGVQPCATYNSYNLEAVPAAQVDGDYWFNVSNLKTVALIRSGGLWSIGAGQSLNTGWLTPQTPTTGTTTSSTTVSFNAPYFFNSSQSYGIYDTVAFDITDVTLGSNTIRFGAEAISASGNNTLSENRILIAGHLYLWRPVMYSSQGTSSPITGTLFSLNALYPSASSTPFIGATVGTSTLPDSTNLLSFLNVPVLLQTKVPFGYFFQAKDAIVAGVNGSTTATIPSGTFTINGRFGFATTSVDMFSTTTIAYFLTPTQVALLRGIMVAVLYFEFIYLLYMRGKSLHII